MIGRRGERGSGISVLAARHDDELLIINTNHSIYRVILSNTNNLYLAVLFQITISTPNYNNNHL